MVIGVVIGATLAPFVMNVLDIRGASTRPWAAALVLVVCGSLGSTLGYWLGDPLRRKILHAGMPGRGELMGGTVFSAAAVLSVMWFLGVSLDRVPVAGLATQIQNSVVLRALNVALPPPPAFLAGVEKDLASVPFPQTFAPGLEPSVAPLQLPTSIDTSGVRVARGAVYRVEGRGCGGIVTGSAYPVAPHYLITNAHVVSGTFRTTVSQGPPGARGVQASVVFFDPERDVAILHVSGVTLTPLAPGDAAHGTQGAVIGYPGGAEEDVEPAVVSEQVRAEGRDIYNDRVVDRQILVIQSLVRPGNSGGPIVDLNGHVIGLVFAASSTNANQAYALTNTELQGDISQGTSSTNPIDTTIYSCAV
jgi:S1-C subfamily serine protease